MINYTEAIELIEEKITPLETAEISIEKSIGYVSAEDIVSSINVVPFRNSQMDGFAVRTSQLKSFPITLSVSNVVYAGDQTEHQYKKENALRIMTGAPVPDIYDAVIKLEDTEFTDNEVTFKYPVEVNQNVRLPGEDLKKGEIIIRAGDVISKLHIGIIASVGLNKISVVQKPNVLIAGSGDEVVEPGKQLGFGQVYDSNSYTMLSLINKFCQSVSRRSAMPDNPKKIKEILNSKYDVVITSGGVSAGDKDYIPKLAEVAGWKTVFHKAFIKPGKPLFFALRDNQYLFGLPGNPLSTAITCLVFVIPALKKIGGLKNYGIKTTPAVLAGKEHFRSKRFLIWPGKFNNQDGTTEARFSPKRSSAALSALLNTDGLIFQNSADNESPEIEVARWDQIL